MDLDKIIGDFQDQLAERDRLEKEATNRKNQQTHQNALEIEKCVKEVFFPFFEKTAKTLNEKGYSAEVQVDSKDVNWSGPEMKCKMRIILTIADPARPSNYRHHKMTIDGNERDGHFNVLFASPNNGQVFNETKTLDKCDAAYVERTTEAFLKGVFKV